MKHLLVIIVLFCLASCKKDAVDSVPYFTFDELGKSLLSEVHLNDTIKFAGSNGRQRKYKVSLIERKKEVVQDCSWNTGSCRVYYYYDHMIYDFSRVDSIGPIPGYPVYLLNVQMQLPRGIVNQQIPKNVQATAVLYGGSFIDFNSSPLQGPGPYGWINFPDFYQPLSAVTFSNSVRSYINVVVIKSGKNAVVTDPNNGAIYTVNEVWFDKIYGIVFFKDVLGNSWSRTN